MQRTQSAVGECDVRYFHLPGMFGQASRPRRPLEFREVHLHGQMEGPRARENESRRQQELQELF